MTLTELTEAEQFLVVLLCRKKYVHNRRVNYQRIQGYRALSKKMKHTERLDVMLTRLYRLDLINYVKHDKDWWVSLTVDLGLPLAVHLWGKLSRGGQVTDLDG